MSRQADNPLYQPPSPGTTPTFRFLDSVNRSFSLDLRDYHELYTWSVQNIDKFWSLVWDHTNIIGHKGDHVVDNSALPSANPPWLASPRSSLSSLTPSHARFRFKDARLNWAENMLHCRSSAKIALIQASLSFLVSTTACLI